MKYKIGKLSHFVCLLPGDSISLNLTQQLDAWGIKKDTKVIHTEEICKSRTYTHWAFCDFGDDIDAVFLGGLKLEQFLIDKFPGIIKMEEKETLFV